MHTIQKHKKPIPWLIFYGLWSLFLFSCSTAEQLTYLYDIDEAGPENFFPLEKPDYLIQKQDILYVRFITMNEDINAILNMESGSRTSGQYMQGESGIFLYGYTVNKDGYISIPLVGKVLVYGKTIDDATASIEEKSAEHLKDATLIVRLLSFKFTVLGEVAGPGTFRNFNNQLTVLEAIAIAGDITEHGNREKILVLRPTKEGTRTFRINLKKKDVLASEAFFLLPNDIVIVEPMGTKIFKMNLPTYSFIITTTFSVLSTTLLLVRFFGS